MSELYPSDAIINALSGTKDGGQEVQYPAIYETPYYTTFYKMVYRLLNVARRAGDFRVYKDGDLTFGVRAGKVSLGSSVLDFEGAAVQSLTDNADNSIYITTDGELHVSTEGFPAVSSVVHIPLAVITTADGGYDFGDIVDFRGLAMFMFNTNLTPQNAQTLTTAQIADSLHSHGATGIAEQAILGSHLGIQLRKCNRYAELTVTDNANGTASLAIAIKDASGAALANLTRVRLWTSDGNSHEPSAQATLSVQDGIVLNTYQSDIDMELLTTQGGTISILASSAVDKDFRVQIELGGVVDIYSVSITGN